MVVPYVSAGAAARIQAAAQRGLATGMRIFGTVPLTLYYDDDQDGTEVQVGPKDVLVEYADREAQVTGSPAGGFTDHDGTFSAFAPWPAKEGARFALPSGRRGRITLVEEERLGIQRARFSLRKGA